MTTTTNVATIREFANEQLQKWGLADWNFEFNRRKNALGLCNFKSKTVYVSQYFTSDLDKVRDTVLHEVAHALAFVRYGHKRHGWQWVICCRQVGANPVPCHDITDMEHTRPEESWRTVCCNCGKVTGKSYRRRQEKTLARRRCLCGGNLRQEPNTDTDN